ncbi:MAG: DUF2997 domain-containing protein [Planctomycetota bacterium]|jgi:hypothetical protein
MSQPAFDITIAKDGKVTVTVSGVAGAECLELSDMLQQIVGREESRQLTSDYYGPEGKVRIDAKVEGRTKGAPDDNRHPPGDD